MLRIALLSLLFSTSLFAELRFTAERPLSPYTIAPAYGAKRSPAIATNGKDFLVVWSDRRSGEHAIVGARLSGSGEVLDPAGFVIHRSPYHLWPSVYWDGAAYRVSINEVWYQTVGQYFYAVSPNGIVTASVQAAPPRVANERGETLEFTGRGSGRYTAWITSPSGGHEVGIELPSSFGEIHTIIPRGGDEWIAVFYGDRRVQWARLSKTAGLVRWREILGEANTQSSVIARIAHDGRNVAVGWMGRSEHEYLENGQRAVFTVGWSTVDEAGIVRAGRLPSETIEFPRFGPEPYLKSIAITGDGTAFHMATTLMTQREMIFRGFRIEGSNVTVADLDEPRRSHGGWRDYSPVLASAERNLLVWTTPGCADESQCHVYFSTFARGGSIADGTASILSLAPPKQDDPRMAAAANATLTVWHEAGPASSIRGRFSNGTAVALSPAGTAYAPRVAANGDTFAVVWIEQDGAGGRVMLRRFDTSGNAIDAQPLALTASEAIAGLELVPRGDVFQVVWMGTGSTLRTIAVPRSGAAGPITTVAGSTFDPRRGHFTATSFGGTTAVVWFEYATSRGETLTRWYVARITAANTVSAAQELVRSQESPGGGDSFTASLGPDSLLLAIPSSFRDGGCLGLLRFTADGLLIGNRELTQCSATRLPSATALWDGSQWWLAMHSGPARLQAVLPNGTPGAAYEVSTDYFTRIASVTPTANGIAVLYTRPDDAAGGARRAFVRTLTAKSEPTRGRAVRH